MQSPPPTAAQSRHEVATVDELTRLYAAPARRSLDKEQPVITPLYERLVAASPFGIVATHGPQGLDCSPRGDGPGFLTVLDEHTLLLPDRRGNNRLDTLKNLLHDNSIALILLIPGVGETIRIRGTAVISTDPDLIARCQRQGPDPVTVTVITVSRVYFQCQRALVRSGLWSADPVDRSSLPTAGELAVEADAMTPEAANEYDRTMDEYVARTLY